MPAGKERMSGFASHLWRLCPHGRPVKQPWSAGAGTGVCATWTPAANRAGWLSSQPSDVGAWMTTQYPCVSWQMSTWVWSWTVRRPARPLTGTTAPRVGGGQRGLHEFFGEVRAAGRQQAGGAQQLSVALGDERRELLVTR
jgi:hypothetical protein